MASNDQVVSFVSEWEYEEESGILNTQGEEADLKTNRETWNSCKKKHVDVNFHERYISITDALRFKDLSSEEKETFVNKKGLTYEDQILLSSEEGVQCLKKFSDAVVCITVKKAYGTGFLVQVNNDVAVITNSHSMRRSSSGKGIDFSMVEPRDVRVTSFYDDSGLGKVQVTNEVERIEKVSPPDKNKEENVLRDTMKKALHGDGTKDSPYIRKAKEALSFLDSYFNVGDAFLDYAFLYLKPLQNEEQKAKFINVKPLEMKPVTLQEHFRRIFLVGFPDRYPHSLRLFSISHPHRKSQQVSFGGLESDLVDVYNLNLSYGQNDTGMIGGKDPFVEHSIATCPGSSGAPIFLYTYNHETGELIVDEGVYFLHFYGEVKGKLHGKAVSFSTIRKNMPLQELHNGLASALAELREYKDDSTTLG